MTASVDILRPSDRLGCFLAERHSSASGPAGRTLNLGKPSCPPCLLVCSLSLPRCGRDNLFGPVRRRPLATNWPPRHTAGAGVFTPGADDHFSYTLAPFCPSTDGPSRYRMWLRLAME
jgi:hypothetical protein